MLVHLLVVALAFGGGFGMGRVKNAKKLAAVRTEIDKAETSTVTEVKKLAADVRAKL